MFSYYKSKKRQRSKIDMSMEIFDPHGWACLDPHDLTGRIRVENHWTLLHTKCIHVSCGPHGSREECF